MVTAAELQVIIRDFPNPQIRETLLSQRVLVELGVIHDADAPAKLRRAAIVSGRGFQRIDKKLRELDHRSWASVLPANPSPSPLEPLTSNWERKSLPVHRAAE